MTVQEVAKNVMAVTHTTQAEVAERAGMSGQGAVGMFLKSKSMRVESLMQILSVCGYELVARDRSGRYPEFVIGDVCTDQRRDDDSRLRDMVRAMVAEELEKIRCEK